MARRSVGRSERLVATLAAVIACLLVASVIGVGATSDGRRSRHHRSSMHSTSPSSATHPTPGFPRTRPAPPSAQAQGLFLSDQVAVVDVETESASLTPVCDRVYATTDFMTWHDITPPATTARYGPCSITWSDASFVSPSVGWILGRVGGDIATVLDRTVDGGRTWQAEQGGSTLSNGGFETIQFINAEDGVREQFADGSSAPQLVQHTTDGGATFTDVTGDPCDQDLDPEVFPTPTTGLVAAPGQDGFASPQLPAGYLCRSTDGGHTWVRQTLPPPPGHASATPVYQTPTFTSGADGVEPVTFVQPDGTAVVSTYTTTDTGRSWVLASTLPTRIADSNDGGTGTVGPDYFDLALPAIAVAPGGAVWVIGSRVTSPRPTPEDGRVLGTTGPFVPSTAQVASTPGGPTISATTDLPVGTLGGLQAADAAVAWAEVSTSAEATTGLVITTDGGHTWRPVLGLLPGHIP